MTHTTTNEKAVEAINSNGLHTDTNGADFLTADEQGKEFATLAAGFALAGHALHRSDPKDGSVTYWAERWGLVRYLPTIDAARRFLDQIGGRL
ncbi:MAG: hypothetical protein Q7K57_42050 [Burkholderiaceae bacterium]|nr:hypothetical protein [Burkholderiaceae bacterium]